MFYNVFIPFSTFEKYSFDSTLRDELSQAKELLENYYFEAHCQLNLETKNQLISKLIITCKREGLSLLTHSNNTCKQNSWKSASVLHIFKLLIITGSLGM